MLPPLHPFIYLFSSSPQLSHFHSHHQHLHSLPPFPSPFPPHHHHPTHTFTLHTLTHTYLGENRERLLKVGLPLCLGVLWKVPEPCKQMRSLVPQPHKHRNHILSRR